MNKTIQVLGLSAAILSGNSGVLAQAENTTLQDSIKEIWSYATLYKDPDNGVLQKLVFTGRLQGDYAHFENDETDEKYRDSSWRRARAGFKQPYSMILPSTAKPTSISTLRSRFTMDSPIPILHGIQLTTGNSKSANNQPALLWMGQHPRKSSIAQNVA